MIPSARNYPKPLNALSVTLQQPKLSEYIRRFLYDQLYPDAEVCGMSAPLDSCPKIPSTLRINVYHSAISTYHAPSDLSGIGGMHRERIRSTPSWKGGPGRYDCIYVDTDPDTNGFQGLHVAQVILFLSFSFRGKDYPCALVQWFTRFGDAPCEDTGLWRVQPDYYRGHRLTSIIHTDSILRAAHLIGVAGSHLLPQTLTFSDSLHAFRLFYVNKYADHHAHEIAY